MKTLFLAALLCSSCDGGGAQVTLEQSQGQEQRPDDAEPSVVDSDPDCETTCNRRFNGWFEVIRTCTDGMQSVIVTPVLPPRCDTINDLIPIASGNGGFTGQDTK